MSNAFDNASNVLDRRDRRRRRTASLVHYLRRGVGWIAVFAVTTLLLLVVAGFAEGGDPLGTFAWPWQWVGRLFGEVAAGNGIARLTGAALVLYCGGWVGTIGIIALRKALSLNAFSRTGASGVLAVARGAVDEAVRNRVVIVLLGLLLVGLALQPYWTLNTIDQPLRYRVQTFLSFSSFAAALLLGGVIILFSAFTVSGDLSERRTGDVFVKPLGRGPYLIGKWLGSLGLIVVLVTTWALVTWGVAALWIGRQDALNPTDAEWLRTRVLVARQEVSPKPAIPFREAAIQELEEVAETNPERIARRGASDLLNDLELEERVEFMSVPFGETKTYVFDGMAEVKRRSEAMEAAIEARRQEYVDRLAELGVQARPEQISLETLLPYADELGIDLRPAILQLKFKVQGISTYGSTESLVRVLANGEPTELRYVVDRVQIVDFLGTLLAEDDPETPQDETGQLVLEIDNRPLPPELAAQLPPNVDVPERTLQFDPETWVNLYHFEGSFANNVARLAVTLAVRLIFLAMLGTVAAALFSFPVAATLSIAIWLLSAGGSWLQSVLNTRLAGTSVAPVDTALDALLKPLVARFASFFAQYSRLQGTSLVIDGQQIPLGALAWHVAIIGVAWTGLVLAVGWFLFSRKEIARVQV